jgi:hypothetical protein
MCRRELGEPMPAGWVRIWPYPFPSARPINEMSNTRFSLMGDPVRRRRRSDRCARCTGTAAVRINPFDPTGPYTVELYRQAGIPARLLTCSRTVGLSPGATCRYGMAAARRRGRGRRIQPGDRHAEPRRLPISWTSWACPRTGSARGALVWTAGPRPGQRDARRGRTPRCRRFVLRRRSDRDRDRAQRAREPLQPRTLISSSRRSRRASGGS